MVGRNTLKRAIKRTAGWTAQLANLLAGPNATGRACVFYYHRVSDLSFVDRSVDDRNVQPAAFERQVAALADCAEIVPLADLQQRLRHQTAGSRPLVSLTFDDGYANFYTSALPILKMYNAPATLFVVTSLFGSTDPSYFDGWARKNIGRAASDAWRPLSWDELESCLASGLVAVGAHSHRHLKGSRCTPAELSEEAEASREILRSRLGDEHTPNAYAYPYGSTRLRDVSTDYVEAVRRAGYRLAVTTDLGLVGADSDPHLLPRIEAYALDRPGVIRAKAFGNLAPYRLIDHLRLVNRGL